ncbi:MAG: subtilisin/minor extracellular protease Epr, partial [Candidatus Methanocomedens sp.]
MMKNFSIAIVAMILLSFLSPVVAMQPKDDEVSVMTPVIIEFNDKVDKKLLENNGGKIKIEYKLRPAVAASLPPKAIENLRKNPNIKSIVNDIEIHTMEYGTSYFSDWGIKQIGADKVHNNGIKGETINVAILDTGADLDHSDLESNIAYSYDFSGDNDPDASDRDGHGTHVAGTIGALLNGNGIVGVAPDVNLYILKVFTDGGSGAYSDIEEALEWCRFTHNDDDQSNDIQIVSMSIGSEYADGDPHIEDCVNDLYNAGILLIGAAGNSGAADDNVIYPARYTNVMAVAATDISNNKASFSSTGPAVEISAPGVLIRSTYKNDRYTTKSGTSMATPHLAGTAALVMAANPGISNVEVRQILRDTADDRGEPGRDTSYGFGLVDAYEAAVPISSNQPPVAVNDEYSVNEDGILNVPGTGVLDNDSDADGDTLTAIIVSDVSSGILSLNTDGSFTYTPNSYFAGTDSFTYTANDGTADSNIATVTITVNPVN